MRGREWQLSLADSAVQTGVWGGEVLAVGWGGAQGGRLWAERLPGPPKCHSSAVHPHVHGASPSQQNPTLLTFPPSPLPLPPSPAVGICPASGSLLSAISEPSCSSSQPWGLGIAQTRVTYSLPQETFPDHFLLHVNSWLVRLSLLDGASRTMCLFRWGLWVKAQAHVWSSPAMLYTGQAQ